MLQHAHPLSFLLMEPTLRSWNHPSLILNGGLTNSMAPGCDMKYQFVYAPGTLFGLTEVFYVENGKGAAVKTNL
jgi:hypothetical protein